LSVAGGHRRRALCLRLVRVAHDAAGRERDDRAARQVREKLLNMAAERLEISESDLDIADS